MKMAMAMGLAISLLFGAETVQGNDTVHGTWKLIAGEAGGRALTEQELQDGKLVIMGDDFSVTLRGIGTTTGKQTLDPMSKPKKIDITNTSGLNKNRSCLGIYELEGNEFRVTFAPPGKARPTEMSTQRGSGNWSHVWKRQAE